MGHPGSESNEAAPFLAVSICWQFLSSPGIEDAVKAVKDIDKKVKCPPGERRYPNVVQKLNLQFRDVSLGNFAKYLVGIKVFKFHQLGTSLSLLVVPSLNSISDSLTHPGSETLL